MSTKTLRKRIALVAVAALGLGVLTSVAPANAAATLAAATITEVAAATTVNTTGVCAAGTPGTNGGSPTDSTMNSAATPNVMQVGGTQQFVMAGTNDDEGVLVISGPANWAATGTPTAATFTLDATQKVMSLEDIDATVKPVLTVTGVGAITVAVKATVTGSTLETYYITAVAECTTTVSAANSFVQVAIAAGDVDTAAEWLARQTQLNTTGAAGSNSATALDTNQDARTLFADNATAYIAVRARDAYKASNVSGTLIISCDNGARLDGTSLSFYSNSSFGGTTTTSNIAVKQAKAGTPMTTSCAVSVNGVELAKKSISFAGDLATITLTASRFGDAETPANGRVSYVYKDSAGNTLSGTTPSLTSGTGGKVTAVLSEYSETGYYALNGATANYAQAYGAGENPAMKTGGYSNFNCLNYGNASITAEKTNTAGTKIISNTAAIRCGGAIDTWTVALDKAKYNQGDIATLTITAKDADGGVPAYGTTPGAGYSVAMPGMTAVVTPATTDKETAARTGVWTYTYTVNAVEGSYNGAVRIAVASTSAQYNKAVTVAYSIGSAGGVSNADVLKAIVSLIASINKQIAALQKALLKK